MKKFREPKLPAQFKIFMANHPHSEVRHPVLQEALQLSKRTKDTGKGVRLHKTVSEELWRIDDTLLQQTLDIEHVPVNAWVVGDPPVQHYEGQTLVVPVLEEVLVVEKRLRLKEEIRVTAKSSQQPVSERVVLRKENLSIEQFDDSDTAEEDPATARPFMTPPESP
jgi:stress response protein YsnF